MVRNPSELGFRPIFVITHRSSQFFQVEKERTTFPENQCKISIAAKVGKISPNNREDIESEVKASRADTGDNIDSPFIASSSHHLKLKKPISSGKRCPWLLLKQCLVSVSHKKQSGVKDNGNRYGFQVSTPEANGQKSIKRKKKRTRKPINQSETRKLGIHPSLTWCPTGTINTALN